MNIRNELRYKNSLPRYRNWKSQASFFKKESFSARNLFEMPIQMQKFFWRWWNHWKLLEPRRIRLCSETKHLYFVTAIIFWISLKNWQSLLSLFDASSFITIQNLTALLRKRVQLKPGFCLKVLAKAIDGLSIIHLEIIERPRLTEFLLKKIPCKNAPSG